MTSATVSAHVADAFAGAWKRLDQDVGKADGLDAVRRAHRAYLDAIASDALFAPRSGIPEEGVPPDEDLAAGALATHLEAVLQAAQRFCALVDAFVADAVAGDSRAVTLAARLDDSTAHFRAAARRFTRLLKRASEDEPEATNAFRLDGRPAVSNATSLTRPCRRGLDVLHVARRALLGQRPGASPSIPVQFAELRWTSPSRSAERTRSAAAGAKARDASDEVVVRLARAVEFRLTETRSAT